MDMSKTAKQQPQKNEAPPRDYQKRTEEPVLLYDFGRVRVMAYNAPATPQDKMARKREELEDLRETLAPFEMHQRPPAHLYASIFMAGDKALLELLDHSRDYRKACITDLDHVTENDALERAKGCQCIWKSRLFLEAPANYPDLFENATKTEGHGDRKKEYHLYLFEPRKLREKTYQRLVGARDYLRACKARAKDPRGKEYLQMFITAIDRQYERFMGLR